MTEREIFLAVLDLPTQSARAHYLDKVCADPAQRARIEALLQSHDAAGSFLGNPVVKMPERDDATQELGLDTSGQNLDSADALEFLEPSSRPDSLGRLGHYEVLQVLGRGGFGIVFRAFDDTLQRVVAIKVLAPHLATTSPARKRFLREARSSAKVRHENIVQVYAVEEQPLPYLVMEFIPGETLQERVDRAGPLDISEVVQFGRQLAEGLAAAHGMGLIHRDIKPGNILIEAGPHPCVKITDFGLARAADDASMTQSGMVAGTPMFMAPEQAQGETLDHRADLFSLGSVLYTICSGRPPFRAANTLAVLKRVVEDTPRPIPEIIPEVPLWLCKIISRLHEKKPENRFSTAREVADLLTRGQAEKSAPVIALPVEKPQSQAVTTAKLPSRFRLSRWAAAAGVLLLLLCGLSVTEATGVTDVRGSVIRLFSPDGTLVVEVDDPGVSITVDGSEIVITGAGLKEIRVKPGNYTIEATKDGKVIKRELVSVTSKGRQIVRVTHIPTKPPPTTPPPDNVDADRLAAKNVLSFGGTVTIDGECEIKAVADLPTTPFRLTHINLGGKTLTASGLAVFKDCKNLTQLELGYSTVTDTGLAHFKNCTSLESLRLGGCAGMTDAGFAHFKNCTNLTDLNLHDNDKVTDAGLAFLKDCNKLVVLDLSNASQVTDAGLVHFKDCKNLQNLLLYGTQVTDAGLAHFKDCPNLKSMHLSGLAVTDAGLTHLSGLAELTDLDLRQTKVTAKGIAKLKTVLPNCKVLSTDPDRLAAEYVLSVGVAVKVNGQPKEIRAVAELPPEPFQLTHVNFFGKKTLTPEGLAVFKDCKHLKELELHRTNVTDAGLAHFAQCKELTFLNLTGTPTTDDGLSAFKDCKKLEHLNLSDMPITEKGLAHFKGCDNLKELWLYSTQVNDAGLALFKDCKNLTSVNLYGTQVTNDGLAQFADCKNLETLHLGNTKIGDASLVHLKNCKSLTKLTLEGTAVTDAGMDDLAGLDKLTVLRLTQTAVTSKRIDELRKAFPKCNVVWDGIERKGAVDSDRRAAEYVLSIGGRSRSTIRNRRARPTVCRRKRFASRRSR